jgi:putative nucleotidyltransferase with HDIG domain
MTLLRSTLLYPGNLCGIEGSRNHSSSAICSPTSLTLAMGAQDPYTQGHARRVAEYGEGLARRLGLGAEDIEIIRIGGLLHDIGKIAFSLKLRRNHDKDLTPAMRAEIRRHPQIGVRFLKSIHVAEPVIDCVRYHHERLDGSGYPCGLKAAEIPLAARIIGVADCFDALTTDRPYQKGRSPAQALILMHYWAGRMFSPELVRLLAEDVRANGVRTH